MPSVSNACLSDANPFASNICFRGASSTSQASNHSMASRKGSIRDGAKWRKLSCEPARLHIGMILGRLRTYNLNGTPHALDDAREVLENDSEYREARLALSERARKLGSILW